MSEQCCIEDFDRYLCSESQRIALLNLKLVFSHCPNNVWVFWVMLQQYCGAVQRIELHWDLGHDIVLVFRFYQFILCTKVSLSLARLMLHNSWYTIYHNNSTLKQL